MPTALRSALAARRAPAEHTVPNALPHAQQPATKSASGHMSAIGVSPSNSATMSSGHSASNNNPKNSPPAAHFSSANRSGDRGVSNKSSVAPLSRSRAMRGAAIIGAKRHTPAICVHTNCTSNSCDNGTSTDTPGAIGTSEAPKRRNTIHTAAINNTPSKANARSRRKRARTSRVRMGKSEKRATGVIVCAPALVQPPL